MVNAGIIGLGPVWETRYLPALQKLGRRVAVRAVYDPVALRAEQVAEELNAVPVQGVSALIRHQRVESVLVLDRAWFGFPLFDLLRAGRKPVYVAGSLGDDLQRLHALRTTAEAEELTVMPEFSLRYTPASSRLQELIATRLGRPGRLVIDAVVPRPDDPELIPGQGPGTDFLVGLLDWCWYVMRRTPARLQRIEVPGTGDAVQAVRIEFTGSDRGSPPTFELRLRNRGEDEAHAAPPENVHYDVACERGEASLHGPARITWCREGGDPVTEALTADRSAVEVMLDQFCRRIVGGLVPIADLADVCRSVGLAKAVQETLRTGEPVDLSPQE